MSKRRKQQSRRPGRWWGSSAGPGPGDRADAGRDPFRASRVDDGEAARRLLAMLSLDRPGRSDEARQALALLPMAVVVDEAAALLGTMVDAAWCGGWQPSELVWHIRRRARARVAAQLVVALVAADAVRVAGADLHPAWTAQLAELGVSPVDRARPVDRHWARRWADGHGPDGTIEAVADLVAVLGRLPRIQVLLPVPGRPDIALEVAAPAVEMSGIDAAVLAKVRALLAKAESTTFEAEAQAFTAKAHELMTRHSLEHVVVVQAGGHDDRPTARRLLIDDPYADAKAYLVQVIAESARCRAISSPDLQMSTVVGFSTDLDAVEVLFTSLLVQAQTALGELARSSRPGSRERSRGFRSSFLRGFAHRIGERLAQARDATVAEVDRDHGGSLVPVLARRDGEVDDQLSALFPELVHRRGARSVDALGWHAGSDAAERAELPWDRLAAPT